MDAESFVRLSIVTEQYRFLLGFFRLSWHNRRYFRCVVQFFYLKLDRR
jgi:hypothetical protein